MLCHASKAQTGRHLHRQGSEHKRSTQTWPLDPDLVPKLHWIRFCLPVDFFCAEADCVFRLRGSSFWRNIGQHLPKTVASLAQVKTARCYNIRMGWAGAHMWCTCHRSMKRHMKAIAGFAVGLSVAGYTAIAEMQFAERSPSKGVQQKRRGCRYILDLGTAASLNWCDTL